MEGEGLVEVEAESGIQGHPQLQMEFQASLGRRSCFKNNSTKQTNNMIAVPSDLSLLSYRTRTQLRHISAYSFPAPSGLNFSSQLLMAKQVGKEAPFISFQETGSLNPLLI